MFNDVVPLWREGNRDEPARAGERENAPETKRLKIRLHRVLPNFLRFSRKPDRRTFTRLCFDLPERAVVSIAVHEFSGRRVRLLAATRQSGTAGMMLAVCCRAEFMPYPWKQRTKLASSIVLPGKSLGT